MSHRGQKPPQGLLPQQSQRHNHRAGNPTAPPKQQQENTPRAAVDSSKPTQVIAISKVEPIAGRNSHARSPHQSPCKQHQGRENQHTGSNPRGPPLPGPPRTERGPTPKRGEHHHNSGGHQPTPAEEQNRAGNNSSHKGRSKPHNSAQRQRGTTNGHSYAHDFQHGILAGKASTKHARKPPLTRGPRYTTTICRPGTRTAAIRTRQTQPPAKRARTVRQTHRHIHNEKQEAGTQHP